jgi:multiple sugar transport system permease protein
MTRKDWIQLAKGLGFLSPWLVGFLGLMLLPLAMSFYYSLCDFALLKGPLFIGLDNYRQLIWEPDPVSGSRGDPVFWKALWNTVRYALMALPAAMLVSLGLALMLNARIVGQSIYRTIIFLPSLVPTVAAAILWLWLFNADYQQGLINGLLRMVGIDGPGWLTSKTWAMPALVFMSLWGVGHTVVIYLAGLQDVPTELYEAAEIDGANAWRRLWHVTVPMISPVIFFNLIMGIIGTLQVFAIPYIMTRGNPDRTTYFYTMYLYDNAFNYLKMGYASALAWLQFLLIIALTGLAFWSSRKWVHYQGK